MNSTACLDNVREVLRDSSDFIISGHVNPDGDAIGACLALGQALRKLGKDVKVVLRPFNEKNLVIPGQDLIWRGAEPPQPAHTFVCLDCGGYERLGIFADLMKSAAVTVCVDHHLSTVCDFAQHMYVDPSASSTCELIYRLLSPMDLLDRDIASAIYAGLLTDTGGFRHGCTSPETMRIAGELLKFGIPFTDIYSELMRRHTLPEAMVLKTALDNLQLTENGRLAYSTISDPEMKRIGADITDTDGIAEYLLNIRGVEASAFFYEKAPDEVKVSLRSTDMDMNQIGAAFGGGGHVNAAGCSINGNIQKAAQAVTDRIANVLRAL
jgi:phosphoesterase RecJ-like protein